MDSNLLETEIFDFTNPGVIESWFVVDDGVMGGTSRGTLRFSESKTALFAGTILLDNDGGFSSIQTQFRPLDFSRYTGIKLQLRGDGKSYGLFLRDNFNSLVYQKNFNTSGWTWQDIRIGFVELHPNWYGNAVTAPPLNLHHIVAISIIVPEKQAGPFKLELKNITVY